MLCKVGIVTTLPMHLSNCHEKNKSETRVDLSIVRGKEERIPCNGDADIKPCTSCYRWKCSQAPIAPEKLAVHETINQTIFSCFVSQRILESQHILSAYCLTNLKLRQMWMSTTRIAAVGALMVRFVCFVSQCTLYLSPMQLKHGSVRQYYEFMHSMLNMVQRMEKYCKRLQ